MFYTSFKEEELLSFEILISFVSDYFSSTSKLNLRLLELLCFLLNLPTFGKIVGLSIYAVSDAARCPQMQISQYPHFKFVVFL